MRQGRALRQTRLLVGCAGGGRAFGGKGRVRPAGRWAAGGVQAWRAKVRSRDFAGDRLSVPALSTEPGGRVWRAELRDAATAGGAGPSERPARLGLEACAAGRAVLGRPSARVARGRGRGARAAHGHRPRGPRRLQGEAPVPGAAVRGRQGATWGPAPPLGTPRRRGWLRAPAVTALPPWGGKAGPGARVTGSPRPRFPLQDTTPDELLSAVMTAVLQDVKLSPTQLGDICVGELATQAPLFALPPR